MAFLKVAPLHRLAQELFQGVSSTWQTTCFHLNLLKYYPHPIHDKMRLNLTREAEALWLYRTMQELAKPLPLFTLYPARDMDAYLSRLVNSPQHDTPDCILPATPNSRGPT